MSATLAQALRLLRSPGERRISLAFQPHQVSEDTWVSGDTGTFGLHITKEETGEEAVLDFAEVEALLTRESLLIPLVRDGFLEGFCGAFPHSPYAERAWEHSATYATLHAPGGPMSGHYTVLCPTCKRRVGGCRCMAKDKLEVLDTKPCPQCQDKQALPPETQT